MKRLFRRAIAIALTSVMVTSAAAIPCGSAAAVQDSAAVQISANKTVKLNKTVMSLGKGESFRLTADQRVKWRTSSSRILTVDQSGNVKAVGVGTAWITAKNDQGAERSCRITVKKAPEKVTLTKGILTLGVGEKFKLGSGVNDGSASAMRKYRSSNSSVIKMTHTDWTGEFVAVKPGVAYVTVRTYNGKESSCKVTVKPAPKKITLTKGVLTLGVGEKYTIGSAINDGAAAAVRTYRSSNNSIVKMTRTDWVGEFVAVKPGAAYVTVRTCNGKESTCKVTVKKEPSELSFERNVFVLDAGKTGKIKPLYLSTEGANKVTYSIENKNIASVDNNGNIKALKTGTTEITVRTYNGKTEKIMVIVNGVKDRTVYPDAEKVNALLNTAKLKPVKTNYPDVDKAVDKIMASAVKSGMTPGQKAQACYKYLAQNCEYASPWLCDIDCVAYEDEDDSHIVSYAYSILEKKRGVCDNFSAAYVVLLKRIGFDADLVGGDVGRTGGGYTGHAWVNVNINGKHLSFDPQVEANNLGTNKTVNYWFYGMEPENTSHLYKYYSKQYSGDFKGTGYQKGIMYFKSRVSASCNGITFRNEYKLPEGCDYDHAMDDRYYDSKGNIQDDGWLKIDKNHIVPVKFKTEMLNGPLPYYVELYADRYVGTDDKGEDIIERVGPMVMVEKSKNKVNEFTWTPDKPGYYDCKLSVYYTTRYTMMFAPDMLNSPAYCVKYYFNVDVD